MNKRDGVWKTYSRKGNVINETEYKDGVNTAILEQAAQKKKEDEKREAEKKAAEIKKMGGTPVKKDSKPVEKEVPKKK